SMSSRPGAGKRSLGRIEGVTTPEAARELMDLRIFVPRASLPELDDDEFYDWQLLNAEVWIDGEVVGRIVQIHHPGPIEVFEIDLGQSEPLFVPSTAEHVLHIDVEAPSVTLQPDALMDDPEDPDAL
ncbi:MAG: ribosome maturation factor RimM, partial [Myxococcota bacterium]